MKRSGRSADGNRNDGLTLFAKVTAKLYNKIWWNYLRDQLIICSFQLLKKSHCKLTKFEKIKDQYDMFMAQQSMDWNVNTKNAYE